MKTPSRSTTSQHGVTLIETGAALAITAIVAAGAAPSLQHVVDARRLDGAAARLANDVHFVRSEAVARNEPLRLSFQATAAGSCYLIHTGAAAQCQCVADGPAQCSGGAEPIRSVAVNAADRVTVQANVASIAFDPLHGTSTPTGTLRVIDARGRAIHHVVNVMGRVRSCSPLAAVPGYRAC